jgi:hypothetical protein
MSNRHYLLDRVQTEITTVYSKTLFFPVCFQLPPNLQETTPAIVAREYEGTQIMRFYTPPTIGSTLIHNDRRWRVIDIEHALQPKGSRQGDKCPIVVAELIGGLPNA